MSRISGAACLWIVVLVAALLRLNELSAKPFNSDEAFTWRLIQYDVREIVQRTSLDLHPPLYYLLLSAWSSIAGKTLWVLRAFSVFLGVGSVLASYGCAFEASRSSTPVPGEKSGKSSQFAGILAAVLLGVHQLQINISRLSRMYALGVLLCLLSTWLLLRALRSERRRMCWVLYTLAAIACCYTHYSAGLVVAAQVVALIVCESLSAILLGRGLDFSKLLAALAAGVGILVSYSPWLFVVVRQVREVRTRFHFPRFEWSHLFNNLPSFVLGVHSSGWPWLVVAGAVAMFPFLLKDFRRHFGLGVVAITTLTSLALMVLVSQMIGGSIVLLPRMFSFVQAIFVVCLATGMALPRRAISRVVLSGLVVGNLVIALAVQDPWRPSPVPQGSRLRWLLDAHGYLADQLILAGTGENANRVSFLLFDTSPRIRCYGQKYTHVLGHQPHVAAVPDEEWMSEEEAHALEDPIVWIVGQEYNPLSSNYKDAESFTFLDSDKPIPLRKMVRFGSEKGN